MASPGAGAGQDSRDTDAASPGAPTFEATLDSVARLDELLAFLDESATGASAHDLELLRRRRETRADERRALLTRLADRIASPADGSQTEADRSALVDSLLAVDAEAREARLQGLIRRSSELQAELASLEGTDRTRLEPVVRRLEEEILAALEDLNEALDLRESLGADVSEAEAVFVADLRLRSEILAARLADADADLETARERLADGEEEMELDVRALETRLATIATSLGSVLTLMEARDLPTADLRRALLVATGDLTAENVSVEVVQGLLGQWWEAATGWVQSNGANLVFQSGLFLLTLGVFWVFARIVRGILIRTLDASPLEMSGLLRAFVSRWTTRAIMLVGLFIALSQVGVELGPILAGVGIAGFIVGFALQDTLANFAAGVMILIYRPFDEGDLVAVGGVTGTVSDMSLVSTTIHSLDNQSYVVPNTMIWGDVIQNYTALATRRVDLSFRIGFEEDIGRAMAVLERVLRSHEQVLDDPEPVVRVGAWGEYAVELLARPWCRTQDYWEVSWSLTRQVKEAFDEAEIRIPLGEHAEGDGDDIPSRGGARDGSAPTSAVQARGATD
jgi:small conductance mechanosensitive channel